MEDVKPVDLRPGDRLRTGWVFISFTDTHPLYPRLCMTVWMKNHQKGGRVDACSRDQMYHVDRSQPRVNLESAL